MKFPHRDRRTAGKEKEPLKGMVCGCVGPTGADVSRWRRRQCTSEFWARKRRTLTVSPAGLIEDIFLKGHLLLHGGECVIIIL